MSIGSSSGWVLFLVTSACVTLSIHSLHSRERHLRFARTLTAAPVSADAYAATLKLLFRPIQAGSRHLTGSLSAGDLFRSHRKIFYEDLFAKCGLSHCKVIHIAGTKGKGSTVECIAASLIAAGHQVGVFTSPHLHTARERIRVNNELITREELVELSMETFALMKHVQWAVFFDYFLTMALLHFGRRQPEYLILECGLGGRYDSTNFCDQPLLSVITSISLDHQAVLGNTIEEIAMQKAGIIKPSIPVFTMSTQPASVLDVFRQEASSQNAPLHIVSIDGEQSSEWVPVGHQTLFENACLARHVLNHLGIPSLGMKNFYWPCRMETFRVHGTQVVLDGCHNQQSVHLFLQSLRLLHPGHRVMTLFGAGAEKNVQEMVEEVVSRADCVVFAQAKHFKSVPEEQLVHLAQQAGGAEKVYSPPGPVDATHGTVASRLQQALAWIAAEAAAARPSSPPTLLAVCGSLFLAADAREGLFQLLPELFGPTDWVRMTDPLV